MDATTSQLVPKTEYPHEDLDWVYSQEHFYRGFEFSPLEGLVYPVDRVPEYGPSLFSYQTNYGHPSFLDLGELEDHLLLLDQSSTSCAGLLGVGVGVDGEKHLTQLPTGNESNDSMKNGSGISDPQRVVDDIFSGSWKHDECSIQSSRSRMVALEMEDIKKHFNVPITRAAKELNVGLTVLKKRCRELNITRWPHRKIKSMKALITNAKELGLTEEIEMLEVHKKMMEQLPEMELTDRAKKLRQACFKANHKKKRALQDNFS